MDLMDVVLGRARRPMCGDWSGAHVCLLPVRPWKGWFPKLGGFPGVLKWAADYDIYIGRPGGFSRRIPNDETVDWAAMSIVKNA